MGRNERSNGDAEDEDENANLPESFIRELGFLQQLQEKSVLRSSNLDNRDLLLVFCETSFSGQNFAGLVMNYADGGTLAEAIERKLKDARGDDGEQPIVPFTERRITWYALQLSEALAYAHERGVYHQDVKSSNVLINWTSGGTLLLSDFGSAIGEGEESFALSEIYASPELQRAYANANTRANGGSDNEDIDGNDDSSNCVRVDGEKVDSFGLGCILFELLCCHKLVDLTGEQTLAEFIADNGVDAALDLDCVQLPWLPNPNLDENNSDAGLDIRKMTMVHKAGYSFALRSLVKTILEPDPKNRWSATSLQTPLRKDGSSPLLTSFCIASEAPYHGELVTVDNIQLGMFVQMSHDWDPNDEPFSSFPIEEVNFHSITVMSLANQYVAENLSFEELRLNDYTREMQNREKGREVGVIVGLDPDAQYTQVLFPSEQSKSKEPMTVRIGAANKFELIVGPPMDEFFAAELRTKHTGLLSCTSLSLKLGKENPLELTVGQTISSDCKLAAIDHNWDTAILFPTKRYLLESLDSPTQPRMFPSSPAVYYVQPRKPQPPPEYWDGEGELKIVEEENFGFRDIVTELFFCEGGGMDIQEYEILSIKRVQSNKLWSLFSQSCAKLASENWGGCNQHRLFIGTADRPPEQLLTNDSPQSFFYHLFDNEGIKFSSNPSCAHGRRYDNGGSCDLQIVLSRVALGKIDESPSHLQCSSLFHSKRVPFNNGVFFVSDTNQAYPEYIISYRKLQGRPSRRAASRSSRSTSSYPGSSHQQLFFNAGRPNMPPSPQNRRISFPSQPVSRPPVEQPSNQFAPCSNRIEQYSSSSGTNPGHILQTFPTPTNMYNATFTPTSMIDSRNQAFLPTPPSSSRSERVSRGRHSDHTNKNGLSHFKGSSPSNNGTPSTEEERTSKTAPKDKKQSASKKKKGKKKKSATKKCVVCLDKDVRRILLPCGHPCLCEVCGTDQGLRKLRRKCPECRGTIKQAVTIYARVVDD